MARLLGIILAGGRSQRFGSNKAIARYGDRALIDHVAAALRPQVDDLAQSGGSESFAGLRLIADRPAAALGPLGGLNGALHDAACEGFDAVVAVPCDTPILPRDLVARLAAGGQAAIAAGIPVIGLWPASLAPRLAAYLATAEDRSIAAWARHADAARIDLGVSLPNINTPETLAALAARGSCGDA